MNQNYTKTIYACFIGYIVQAVVNNFVPLLFVTFQNEFSIPLSKITFLITINFCIQLLIDLFSAKFVDRIGYKVCILISHIACASGLILLTILPRLMDPYTGILLSVTIYAIGGGLIEVLISPIIEACPTDNKESAMSLLHSFYCWGHMGVVLFSTLFFHFFGIENWRFLAIAWACIPVINAFLFSVSPMPSILEENETGMTIKELCGQKIFWVLMLMMLCSGASEQSVSQWVSTFVEQGLGVSKTIGDLAGPMSFAFMMGLSRLLYGKYGDRIQLDQFMKYSCILCILCYLVIAFIQVPLLSLIACAFTGFSVGIMWPGTFSISAASLKNGGTALFALLALAGDLGCSSGPTLVGMISSVFDNNLHTGILSAIIFPILLFLSIRICGNFKKDH